MARPTKRTPARREAILTSLRLGNTRTAAARGADLSLDVLARWMAGSAEFRVAVEKAEADAEQRFLGQVAKAAGESWQAAAWWLERRRYQDYARRDRMTMAIDLRQEAERMAADSGLDVDAVMAEAERALRDSR